jgi:acyl-coenzyme A synthetase/AMP-(fatty) acid ligase
LSCLLVLVLVLFTRYARVLLDILFILVLFYNVIHHASKFVQVVFAGFSADSLAQRIVDCKPKLVLTCNAVKRGVKPIFLKDIVDAALVESEKTGVSVGMRYDPPYFDKQFS